MLHCCTHTNKTLYWHRNYIHVNTTHHNVNTPCTYTAITCMYACMQNYMYLCVQYRYCSVCYALVHTLYMYLHTLHVTEVSFTWTGRLHRGHGEISVYRPVATVFIQILGEPKYSHILTVATCKGYTIVKTITHNNIKKDTDLNTQVCTIYWL